MVACRPLLLALSFIGASVTVVTPTPAATIDRSCSITASGDACIFTLRTMGSGNLSVSTKSRVPGQRWRTTIARLNTGETVGQVNAGSASAFTGAAVRSTARNTGFVVIVSLALCTVGIYLLIQKTRVGAAMRAVGWNPVSASLGGVNSRMVILFPFRHHRLVPRVGERQRGHPTLE